MAEGLGEALWPAAGLLGAGLLLVVVGLPAAPDGWPPAAGAAVPLAHAQTAVSGASTAAVTAAARNQPPAAPCHLAFLAGHLSIADVAS